MEELIRVIRSKSNAYKVKSLGFVLSPPQRLPLGIPIKISIIDKNRKRAGDDGKRETAGPARSLFLSPQPPHNTKASPQYKEASAEERGLCL